MLAIGAFLAEPWRQPGWRGRGISGGGTNQRIAAALVLIPPAA
jgi:hypothetical protein